MSRVRIPDFEEANPIYRGASVTFYTVDANGAKTATKATLYAGPVGATTLANPQILDSEGKFKQAVYIGTAVIGTVSGLHVSSHDTAAIFTLGAWRGDWATGTLYYPGDMLRDGANGDDTKDIYRVVGLHTSGTWATDKADATKLALVLDFSVIAALYNLPDPGTLTALDVLRVNAAQTGYEGRSAAELREDVSPLTTRGDVIRGGASGVQQRLALGATGRYLKSDGTDLVYSDRAALEAGKQVIGCWGAEALKPQATNGCANLAWDESATNDVMTPYLAFDAASQEYAQFRFRAPAGLNVSAGFTALIIWKEAGSATAHDCVWEIDMQAQGDGDTIDSAFGTAVTVTDTGTAGTRRITPAFATITPGGTWAAGDEIIVRVSRDAANGSDTLDVDAHLIEVVLFATYAASVEP